MRPFRRKKLPADLGRAFAVFTDVLRLVERANGALAETIPSARARGRSLADGLHEFGELLAEADPRMSS